MCACTCFSSSLALQKLLSLSLVSTIYVPLAVVFAGLNSACQQAVAGAVHSSSRVYGAHNKERVIVPTCTCIPRLLNLASLRGSCVLFTPASTADVYRICSSFQVLRSTTLVPDSDVFRYIAHATHEKTLQHACIVTICMLGRSEQTYRGMNTFYINTCTCDGDDFLVKDRRVLILG